MLNCAVDPEWTALRARSAGGARIGFPLGRGDVPRGDEVPILGGKEKELKAYGDAAQSDEAARRRWRSAMRWKDEGGGTLAPALALVASAGVKDEADGGAGSPHVLSCVVASGVTSACYAQLDQHTKCSFVQ
jgi:hypothetical protein